MDPIKSGYTLVALASMASSAYVGYNNAKGIHVEHEFALRYGSAIAHAVVGLPLLGNGLYHLFFDKQVKKFAGTEVSLAVGFMIGSGTVITGLGALESLVGYGIGYVAGRMS